MSGATSSFAPFVAEMKDVDRDFVIPATPGSQRDPTVLHALVRVSLRLQTGEFVFLTGPSGAGKTTLLKLILGLDTTTRGEVHTLGRNLKHLNETQRRQLRRQVGIVFQDHRLLGSMNVYENVELPLHFMGLSKKERARRVDEILEAVQMTDHAQGSVLSLSAGEKQRIGIARALVTCPALVVADEPTGNLDPATARAMIRMLRELKGHGTTVLIATHDMSLVRDFGGRILELVGGSVPAEKNNPYTKAYKVPRFWTADTNRRVSTGDISHL